jgi:predicted RNA-binding protein YlxR (DUF448 family)
VSPGAAREPERTCVACRGKAPKRSLLRIARDPAGAVGLDRAGGAPGRGAYVHRDEACVGAALERARIGRALRTRLGPEELATLAAGIEEELTQT